MQSYSIPNYKDRMDYSIKKYDDNNYELIVKKFNSGVSLDPFKDKPEQQENDFKLDNNLSRARTNIFDISMSNNFDYFITLTLNPQNTNVFDLDGFINTFGQFIRDYRKKNRKRGFEDPVQYLLIPEQHKTGAWHMHGLIKGIPKEDLFINSNGYLDWGEYKKRFGYVSLSPVKSKIGVSKYITKYISKSLAFHKDRKHKKLYYSTRGLKRAETIQKGEVHTPTLYRYIQDKKHFENDFIVKHELTKKDLEHLFKSNVLSPAK